MKREEAVEALALIRSVVEKTRDEAILQNWGEVFILAGILKLVCSVVTDHWLRTGGGAAPFLILWSGYIGVLLLLIFFLRRRRPGVKTFVEKQIWGIWTTYILAVFMTALVNYLLGLPILALTPIAALLAAIGWATMAVSISWRFLAPALLFAALTVAMCGLRSIQWILLGSAWFVTLESFGIYYLMLKRRLPAEPNARFL